MKWTFQIPKKLKNRKGEEVDTHLVGKISCNVPGYEESQKILQEIRFKVNKEGEVVPTSEDEQDLICMKMVPKYVESVDVKSADGEFEFKSIDDLGACAEGKIVIAKVSTTIFGGITLSKKS